MQKHHSRQPTRRLPNYSPQFEKWSAPEQRTALTALEKVDVEKMIEFVDKIRSFAKMLGKKKAELEIFYHGDGDGAITAYIAENIMGKVLRDGTLIRVTEISPKSGAVEGREERIQETLRARGRPPFGVFACDLFMGSPLLAELPTFPRFLGAIWLDHHEAGIEPQQLSRKLSRKRITLISPTLFGSDILGKDGLVDAGAHNAASLAEAIADYAGLRNEKVMWLADVARIADYAPAKFGNFSPSPAISRRDAEQLAAMLNLVCQAGNGGGAIALTAIEQAISPYRLMRDPLLLARYGLLKTHMERFASQILEAAEEKPVIVGMLGDDINIIRGERYALASAMVGEISGGNEQLAAKLGDRPLILGVKSGKGIKLSIRWNNLENRDAGALVAFIGAAFGDGAAGGSKGAGGALIPMRSSPEETMAEVERLALHWLGEKGFKTS